MSGIFVGFVGGIILGGLVGVFVGFVVGRLGGFTIGLLRTLLNITNRGIPGKIITINGSINSRERGFMDFSGSKDVWFSAVVSSVKTIF